MCIRVIMVLRRVGARLRGVHAAVDGDVVEIRFNCLLLLVRVLLLLVLLGRNVVLRRRGRVSICLSVRLLLRTVRSRRGSTIMLLMLLMLLMLAGPIVLIPYLLLLLLGLLLVRVLISVHVLLLLLLTGLRLVVRAVDLALELPKFRHQPRVHGRPIG